jgi:hypothetical protein
MVDTPNDTAGVSALEDEAAVDERKLKPDELAGAGGDELKPLVDAIVAGASIGAGVGTAPKLKPVVIAGIVAGTAPKLNPVFVAGASTGNGVAPNVNPFVVAGATPTEKPALVVTAGIDTGAAPNENVFVAGVAVLVDPNDIGADVLVVLIAVTAPGFGVSQAAHLLWSSLFCISHTGHSQPEGTEKLKPAAAVF